MVIEKNERGFDASDRAGGRLPARSGIRRAARGIGMAQALFHHIGKTCRPKNEPRKAPESSAPSRAVRLWTARGGSCSARAPSLV
jgi:hypothetical protein